MSEKAILGLSHPRWNFIAGAVTVTVAGSIFANVWAFAIAIVIIGVVGQALVDWMFSD